MRVRAAVLIVLVLAVAAAPAAAQNSPFGGLAPAQTTPDVTVAAPASSGGVAGLQTWQETLIVIAGVALIAGIGLAIVADARSRAPVSEAELGHPGMGGPHPNRSPEAKQRARAKAKAARRQRRANR